MARLWRPQNVSFWYLIPVALGLHGVILSTPIVLEEAAKEKPQTASLKMQKLPPSKVAASPTPSSSPQPVQQTVQQPIQQTVQQPIQQPVQQPVQQPIQQPIPPIQKPIPPAQQPVQQPPVKAPDAFQIQGATACDRVKDCYASPETNGRAIAKTLEEKLEAQGYTLTAIDLDEDTGMKIYHLFQNGQPKDYLHIIWTDKGTRSLRLPEPEKNYDQLLLKAKF
jgi:hypothetical protein